MPSPLSSATHSDRSPPSMRIGHPFLSFGFFKRSFFYFCLMKRERGEREFDWVVGVVVFGGIFCCALKNSGLFGIEQERSKFEKNEYLKKNTLAVRGRERKIKRSKKKQQKKTPKRAKNCGPYVVGGSRQVTYLWY